VIGVEGCAVEGERSEEVERGEEGEAAASLGMEIRRGEIGIRIGIWIRTGIGWSGGLCFV
jgi:hypothetical protein